MERRDYIKDQIEQFSRVVKALIEKIVLGNTPDSGIQLDEIEDHFTELYGLSVDQIKEEQISEVRLNHTLLFELATLYFQAAKNNTKPISNVYFEKSLKLAEKAQSLTPGYSIEYQELLNNIAEELNKKS